MRHIVALPVVAGLAAFGLAGCTSTQESQALAAINVACTAAGVGSQIAINVASGGSAAAITGVIGQDVASSCALLVPAVQTAVNQITNAGQTATVTVSTDSPSPTVASMRGKKHFRFTARRDAATGQVVYVIPPGTQLPFLSDFSL